MRIDKLLSTLQYGSRKEIKQVIKEGLVLVNDTLVTSQAQQVDPVNDTIIYNESLIYYNPDLTLMMHKPAGVVSANVDNLHETVIDLLPEKYFRLNLKVAGRLDMDATGLLILTNNGKLIHSVITPHKDIEKVYEVKTKEPISDIDKLYGVKTLLDGNSEPYKLKPINIIHHQDNAVTIGIKEGKFHQIKRLFEAINHEVIELKRIQINDLVLDDTLLPGDVKVLDKEALYKLTSKEAYKA